MPVRQIPRNTNGVGRRVGIVLSRFNPGIGDLMLAGALRALKEAGVGERNITVATVPGALETPLALQRLAQTGDFDALVALGAVIRGETYHFEIVANESARGVAELQLEFGIPIGNGILTTDTGRAGAHALREEGRRGRAGGPRAREPAGSDRCGLARGGARANSCCRALPAAAVGQPGRCDPGAACRGGRLSEGGRGLLRRAVVGRHRRIRSRSSRCSRLISIGRAAELSPIERAILVIGAWELEHRVEIPCRVVINEAIELAKSYGGTDGHRFVNGVLDKLAATLRAAEMESTRARHRHRLNAMSAGRGPLACIAAAASLRSPPPPAAEGALVRSTARTTRMRASLRRRRSRATPGSPSRW